MRDPDTNPHTQGSGPDAHILGLRALGWTLADEARAARLLAVTGLDPAMLRVQAGEGATLAAVLGFLLGHEPDLLACADALGVPPAALIAAHRALEG